MDDLLIDRMRNSLMLKEVNWTEKRMFGGTTFMIDDKMCFGTFRDGVLFRIDPEEKELLLDKPFANIMKQKGGEMKAYIHVLPAGYESDQELDFWIAKCIEFKAKASKKKKKK